MESQISTTTERKPPRDIAANRRAYAFERSLGIPPAEACRRVGGKIENGHATKWERSASVQAWISWYRSLGHTDEMMAAKRQRIEDELQRVGTANMDDFVKLVPSISAETIEALPEEKRGHALASMTMFPVLDLTRLNALPESQRRDAMAAVKTIKYTENGPTFELHGKLDALNQLRDMHGFSAVKKTALTDPTGKEPASLYLISEKPMSEAEWEAQRTSAP